MTNAYAGRLGLRWTPKFEEALFGPGSLGDDEKGPTVLGEG